MDSVQSRRRENRESEEEWREKEKRGRPIVLGKWEEKTEKEKGRKWRNQKSEEMRGKWVGRKEIK